MTAKSDGSGPGIGCTCYSTCGNAYEDEESGSVTIDGVTLPDLHMAQVQGTEPLPALPHLNWTISEIKYTYDTWTLTPKP